jgi:DNA repair protein RecO (recombination protein O)
LEIQFHSEAIVLKNMDYQEADKLVSVFSAVRGKIQVVARGVKKPGSSLRALVQPFCHVQLYLVKGRSMAVVTQGRMIDFYGNIRQDLFTAMQAVYMMELLDKALMDEVPLPKLFYSTHQVLRAMNEGCVTPLLLRYFEVRLLVELGYTPVLDRCVNCGSKEIGAGLFKLAAGGLLCPQCARQENGLIAVRPDSLALLRLLTNASAHVIDRIHSNPASLNQLEWFLEQYLEYYLERRFTMKHTIRWLKKNLPVNG